MKSQSAQILEKICNNYGHLLAFSECKEALELIETAVANGDELLDLDGKEYRIIGEDEIWNIYVETIKDIVNDCYDLKLDEVPNFIALEIDWEQTATNACVDGYGHTFSSYDGSELNAGGCYIFRTN